MLSYLMVFVVPVIFFLIFLGICIGIINAEVRSNNQMSIEYVSLEMDQIFRDLNISAQELLVNAEIDAFRGKESINEIPSYDLYTMITTVARTQNTKASLSGLILYCPDLDLYISDVHYGRISSMALLDEYSFSYSQSEIDDIFSNKDALRIYDASYTLANGNRISRMLITRPISFVRQDNAFYIGAVAEISFPIISDEIFRNLMIFSSFGSRSLLYDFSGKSGFSSLDDITESNEFNEVFISSMSDETSITYVLSFNWFEFYSPIILLAIIAILYFVFTISAGLTITRRIVKRNWQELNDAAQKSGLELKNDEGGIYSPFIESITKLEGEKQTLAGVIEQQTKSLKTNILEKLISQDESLVISKAALDECGIRFLSDFFIVLLSDSKSKEEEDLIIDSLQNDNLIVYPFYTKLGCGFILSLGEGYVKEESNAYKEIAVRIRELMMTRPLDAAASNISEGVSNLGNAYLEALNTFEYKKVNNLKEFVFYRDIVALSGHVKYDYPSEIAYAITDALNKGDAETAIERMRYIIEENKEKGANPRHIRYLLFSIANTILLTYSRLEARYGAEIKPVVIPPILQTRNMDNSIAKIEECINELCISVKKAKENEAESQKDENYALYLKVIAAIENRYSDVLLNVSQIAEDLGISIAQLSKVFKKYHNMNLSDYIAGFRINKAKEMLANSEHTISEIAELCGFGSLRTFMRVFKKEEGTSPGAYRQYNKEE